MWLTNELYYVKIWEWIIFFVSLIILLTYLYIQLTAPDLKKYVRRNALTWLSVDDVFQKIENGDIILMAGNTVGERTCRKFADSVFSHVGLLFREIHPETGVDIVYIWDCDLGQKSKEGVRVMPLRDKLRRYKGYRIAALKKLVVSSPAKRPTQEDIIGVFPKYVEKKFDNKILSWWVANWGWMYDKVKNPNTMFCSELVAATLQDLGILKKNKVSAWYHPGNFDRATLDLESGYSYKSTFFFNF
uniref:Protein OPG091 n=1 Tax=Marseillevirus LCMAC102 TaxID=2506603 RepID=A0A481YTN1_9VIRU|nr:MAG: permuted papain-like amidase [Marseillevirus LCMAC102]